MKLRVFEAFAGIGAQHAALEKANIDYEIVGISEWFINALNIYDAIHSDPKSSNYNIKIPTKKEILDYLKKFTFSKDSVNPIKDISKLSMAELENLYIYNKRTKNVGSITEIHSKDIPTHDLLVYSFPCQDLSTGGKTQGMAKGSGTRSGLLWEIERILLELNEENRLPEYLLMENVKAIFAKSNKNDLDQWLNFLESIGYCNSDPLILNALDFGIPQDRKRAFIVSHLKKKINVNPLKNIKHPKTNFLNFVRDDYDSNILIRKEADAAQLNATISRQEMWKINKREINSNTIVNTITCNMDRSNTAAMFKYNGAKGNTYRLLTIREAFLLMGFTEKQYESTLCRELSYRKMNKLIGNSIVVDVLVGIFELLFKKKYGRK